MTAAPLTDPWSGEDDDTGYGYCDTPPATSGVPAPSPGSLRRPTRAAGLLPGREAAAGVRPAGSRRLSSSLIVRTGHPRPGRGSAFPDKETP
jgi:hypothetical protein